MGEPHLQCGGGGATNDLRACEMRVSWPRSEMPPEGREGGAENFLGWAQGRFVWMTDGLRS